MNTFLKLLGASTLASFIFFSGFVSGRKYSKSRIVNSGSLVVNTKNKDENGLFLKLELDIESLEKMDAVVFKVVSLK